MLALYKDRPDLIPSNIMVRDADAHATAVCYEDVLQHHQGDSWFGCAAGYRAMQKATRLLFPDGVLNRNDLYIVSGHPGAGIKDAIEIVTRCISRDRYQPLDATNVTGCNRAMRFEWWLSDGQQTAHVAMRDGIVPDEFFDIAERVTSGQARDNDDTRFKQLKINLSEHILGLTLEQCFDGALTDKPLALGELPDA